MCESEGEIDASCCIKGFEEYIQIDNLREESEEVKSKSKKSLETNMIGRPLIAYCVRCLGRECRKNLA